MNAIDEPKIQRTHTPKQRQLRIMFLLYMIAFMGFLFTSPKRGNFEAYLFYLSVTAAIVVGSYTLLCALEVHRERRGE